MNNFNPSTLHPIKTNGAIVMNLDKQFSNIYYIVGVLYYLQSW